jgi:hypothetical protein
VSERLRVRCRLDTHDAVAADTIDELGAKFERVVADVHLVAADRP